MKKTRKYDDTEQQMLNEIDSIREKISKEYKKESKNYNRIQTLHDDLGVVMDKLDSYRRTK